MTSTAPTQRPRGPAGLEQPEPARAARGALRPGLVPGPAQRRRLGARRRPRAAPGDGVLAGAGSVGGRPVFCYSQDPAFMGGSLGEAHADSIVRVMRLAGQRRRPGGRLRRVGRRPAAGGPRRARRLRADLPRERRALVAGCRRSRRHRRLGRRRRLLAGAHRLRGHDRAGADVPHRAEDRPRRRSARSVSMEDLGGPDVHERNGVCQLVAADERDGARRARELLAHLPGRDRRAAAAGARARGARGRPVGAGARRGPSRLRRPRGDRGAGRRRRGARARARAGPATWSPRSPGSTAARSA